ncbi:hypothetical protein HZB60_04095 [candidate division KSB1 bacterium]|nr:hypothetical protein [candidate division KSB1 bacterium]
MSYPAHPAIMFRATMSAATQSVTLNTTAIVQFDTAAENVGGGFNTATYKFTAPVAGVYEFTASVNFNANSGAYSAYVLLYKNTSTNVAKGQGYTNDIFTVVTQVLTLAAGDTIHASLNAPGVARTIYGNDVATRFEGVLLRAA